LIAEIILMTLFNTVPRCHKPCVKVLIVDHNVTQRIMLIGWCVF